jgi:hypothetical protein
MKSKNDTSLNDDSDNEVDNLKEKLKIKKLLMTIQMMGRTKESQGL